MSDFRDVLHTWARRILQERSGHTGPFEILDVGISHDTGSSISNESVEVSITFDHGTCTWSAEYLARYGHPPCSGRQMWTLPGTTDTVTMLNELLALGTTPSGEAT